MMRYLVALMLAIAPSQAHAFVNDQVLSAEALDAAIAAAGLAAAQNELIVPGNPAFSTLYLDGPTFPQPNLRRIDNGHLQILGQSGSWASQTNLLTVVLNSPGNNWGNQGGYWDPTYRTAYAGQDASAMFILARARPPIARAASVSTFGTASITTPAGPRTVYTVTLATPLTAAQIADIASRPPNLRIETNNSFFGYLIPSGYAVPPVSADGRTLTVDNWVRAKTPVVASSVGALPSSYDAAPYTVAIDVITSVADSYGGWRIDDADMVRVAMDNERVFINNKATAPPINLLDPINTSLLAVGDFAGVQANAPGGSGVGVAWHVANEGWQAAYIARNKSNTKTGNTYGFLATANGPTFALYSTQAAGWVMATDPGDTCNQAGQTCRRTWLQDVQGNATSLGTIHAVRFLADRGVSPGSFTLATLPGCTTDYPGALIYVNDGRKPGEATGAGSGVPANCTSAVRGASPAWVSVYDHTPVSN